MRGNSPPMASTSSPDADQISDSLQSQLQKSFSSAEQVAEQYPQYSQAIIAGARTSFLDGADWAYTAGIVAIVLGAAVVFFLFPRRDQERELLMRYHQEDTAAALPSAQPT